MRSPWQLVGEWSSSVVSNFAGGALVGVVAAWMWRPSVGSELGIILDSAPRSALPELIPVALFVLGICVPLIILITLPQVFPRLGSALDSRNARITGGILSSGLALLVIFGRYEDIVWELYRRSSF